MFDFITIGSATRDHFLKVDYELIDWPKTPLKKAYVLPFGEKLDVASAYFTIGGNSVNAAVTFARQDLKTACLAKLGSDAGAHDLKERLKKEGVDVKLIVHSAEEPTAFSVLLLKGGERTIIGYHGASNTFRMEDINLRKLMSRWWYLSLSGESDNMYLPLLRFAKEHKVKVAFNPSGHHIKHRREEILSSLRDLAVLVLNAGEAAELVGIPFQKEKEVFKKIDELLSPGIVVVTDGPNGVAVSDGKNTYKAGIFREQEVVDRTGCGDAFGSGFVAILSQGGAIPEAIRFASANATAVLERIGGTEGILTKKDFENDLRWKDFPIEVKHL